LHSKLVRPSTEQLQSACPEATILIVDDSAAWRDCVRDLLATRPELQVVDEACDGLQAICRAAELKPDLVLLDIGMPILNGIDTAKEMKRTVARSKIVFLTQENDSEIRSAALDVGALGYVLKANAASELIPTITAVLLDGHGHAGNYADALARD
jgi:DNA-binding NarL/FixJ family response regulator